MQVLTYSSLGSKGGFLNSIKEDFHTKTGCELKIETTLGAAQMLSYLEEPKQRERLDFVMGIDEILFERARSYLYLSPASNTPSKNLVDFIRDRSRLGFYPIDYGALSFIYRKEDFKKKNIKLPTQLQDLLKPDLKKKFILQDPRASSPGLLFFLFTDSILKIPELKKQWLTLAPSWDSSYKMFLQKDAPMVWSYLTSMAYHASKNEADQYGWIDFKEGLPVQVEGMALVDRVGNPFEQNPCDQKWIDYIYQPEIQTKLVEKQWMMPVVKGTTLPKLFESVPMVKKVAMLPLTAEKVDQIVNHFAQEVAKEVKAEASGGSP